MDQKTLECIKNLKLSSASDNVQQLCVAFLSEVESHDLLHKLRLVDPRLEKAAIHLYGNITAYLKCCKIVAGEIVYDPCYLSHKDVKISAECLFEGIIRGDMDTL